MHEKFRIKVNLVTKEVEIDGSEDFVSTSYEKIKIWLSEPPKKRSRKAKDVEPALVKKEPAEKRVTNAGTVLALIQASAKGISTAEIKAKTGLAEHQIWAIVNHAKIQGKINKGKRGLYVAAG